jgi:F0F1-type ATP synthase membrane subunit b/b'
MVQKLLSAEKAAAGVVATAEAEAEQLVARARLEAQKQHGDLVKAKAAEQAAELDRERERLAADREKKTRAEEESLSRLPRDDAAFRAAVFSFIPKGRR